MRKLRLRDWSKVTHQEEVTVRQALRPLVPDLLYDPPLRTAWHRPVMKNDNASQVRWWRSTGHGGCFRGRVLRGLHQAPGGGGWVCRQTEGFVFPHLFPRLIWKKPGGT